MVGEVPPNLDEMVDVFSECGLFVASLLWPTDFRDVEGSVYRAICEVS